MIQNPHHFIKEGYKEYCRSFTCLNGILPQKIFFEDNNLPIIAVDGGLDHLIEKSVIPDLVIGDLDTVKKENLLKTKVVKVIDDNTFDFEKALVYLQEKKLLPTLVLGVNGGYLDQILNNINIVIEHGLMFYDPPLFGVTLSENQVIKLPLYTKISFIGKGSVSTTGLKWNLNQAFINFPGYCSVSNRTMNESITITLHEGKILILIYLEAVDDLW